MSTTNLKKYELTPFEKYITNMNVAGDFLVMGTAFVTSNNAPVDQEIFRRALVYTQQRHPFFRAYLEVQKKENHMFIVIDESDTSYSDRIVIEWVDWTSEAPCSVTRERVCDKAAEFNAKLFEFDKDHLLWRAQVIAYKDANSTLKYVINLVMMFTITDGINSTTLTIELINIINSLLTNQVCIEMTEKLEPSESLHKVCEERKLYVEEKHRPVIEEITKRQIPKFRLDPKLGANDEKGFKLDLFPLNEELTKRALASCKANGVRLTSFFQTAILYALKDLYNELSLDFPKQMTIEMPVSLRVRFNPPINFSYCRIHTTIIMFPLDEDKFGKFENFWQDARYIHKLIVENTSSETGTLFAMSHDNSLDDFNQVFADSETLEQACNIVTDEVHCDVGISNLGTFVNDHVKVWPEGPLIIDELYCTDSLISQPPISLSLVLHKLFWRGRVMAQMGANLSSFNSIHFNRFKELYLNRINNLTS